MHKILIRSAVVDIQIHDLDDNIICSLIRFLKILKEDDVFTYFGSESKIILCGPRIYLTYSFVHSWYLPLFGYYKIRPNRSAYYISYLDCVSRYYCCEFRPIGVMFLYDLQNSHSSSVCYCCRLATQ